MPLDRRAVFNSAAFYPVTGLYLGGVLIGFAAADHRIKGGTAIVLFFVLAAFALLIASWRELRAVHRLVNGQRHELVTRIDELTALLVASGIVIPARGHQEQDALDARNDDPR